jgi:hypothetical protein
MPMKRKAKNGAAVIIGVVALCLLSPAASAFAWQGQSPQAVMSAADRQAVAAFEGRVKDYAKMREQLEEKLPKLSKEATPEQIKAHQTALMESVRAARAGAKPGDVFSPDAVNYIRATIKDEFKGEKLKELRTEVLTADTKGVPLRVNYPYPEFKELVQIPPTLLLRLPQLPKQVRYRFVGRHMLLVDRENNLIIDYTLNVLP